MSLSPMLLSSLSLGEAAVPAPDAGWEGFCHEELAPGGDKGGETPPLSGGVGALCCLLTAAAASVDGQGPQAAGCHRGRGRAHSAPSCGQAQIQHNPGALRPGRGLQGGAEACR